MQDIANAHATLRELKDRLKKEYRKYAPQKTDTGSKIILPQLFVVNSEETRAQSWLSNGFAIDVSGWMMIVDPGLDFYTRFAAAGLDLRRVGLVFISHWHSDHTLGLPAILERLVELKREKQAFPLQLVMPTGWEQELSAYQQGQIHKLAESGCLKLHVLGSNVSELEDQLNLEVGLSLNLNLNLNLKMEFLPLKHSTQFTFGFKLSAHGGTKLPTLGYLSDTGYAVALDHVADPKTWDPSKLPNIAARHDYIRNFYRDTEVLISNINDLAYNRHSQYHLSGWDLADIIEGSKVRKLILQHLSPIAPDGSDQSRYYRQFFEGVNGLGAQQIFCPKIESQEIAIDWSANGFR